MKRKRKITGRFLTTNRLPKEKPSLDEVEKGQKDYDVRSYKTDSKSGGSPYWDWMEKHGAQTEDGDIIESPLANPDVLAEGQVMDGNSVPSEYELTRMGIDTVLTEKQRHVMVLLIDGFSQEKIAHNLGIKIQSVSQCIRAARKKLLKYLDEHTV